MQRSPRERVGVRGECSVLAFLFLSSSTLVLDIFNRGSSVFVFCLFSPSPLAGEGWGEGEMEKTGIVIGSGTLTRVTDEATR